MGRPPSDIDIATEASPQTVCALFQHTIPIAKHFGVILVVHENETFEVATFRTEGTYEDGRRPSQVSFVKARDDVERRDFTINGLLYDPIVDQVLDWVGGEEDIRNKLIRSIGDPGRRFAEDKLRLLRAVRFAANLDFQIEWRTGEALRKMASQISIVSAERIRDELVKTFAGRHPDRGLILLDRYGLLPHLLPEISAMKGVLQGILHHPEGDVFAHTVKILSLLKAPSVSLAFSTLLHDVGKQPTCSPGGGALFPRHAGIGAEMADTILKRLRFDGRTRRRIVDAVAVHLQFLNVRHMRPSRLRSFMDRGNFTEELELHRLDCIAGNGDLTNWRFIMEEKEELIRNPLPPKPLLRGRDLLTLGFRPGPIVGRILKAIELRRLEGTLRNRKEAVEWLEKNYRPED